MSNDGDVLEDVSSAQSSPTLPNVGNDGDVLEGISSNNEGSGDSGVESPTLNNVNNDGNIPEGSGDSGVDNWTVHKENNIQNIQEDLEEYRCGIDLGTENAANQPKSHPNKPRTNKLTLKHTEYNSSSPHKIQRPSLFEKNAVDTNLGFEQRTE